MAITKNSQIDLNGNEMILDADGDTTITADTDDQIDFKTGGTDRVTIDASGDVLVGTSTINTGTLGTSNTFLEVSAGTSSGSGTLILSRNTSTNNVELGGVRFVNANNADDDGLDADGKLVAAVSARSVTSDSNAGDDSGADLIFYTKPEAGNYAERGRFLSSGGLSFNGDTAAANALDDYEEGTVDWYTLTDGTATWTQSNANNRYASYTKIGNQVHVHGNIFNGSISGSQAGPVRVPLPYTNANTSSGQNRAVGIAAVYNGSSAYTGDYTLLKVEAGASYGTIVSGGNNGQWGTVTLPTSGTIIIDIFYTAA